MLFVTSHLRPQATITQRSLASIIPCSTTLHRSRVSHLHILSRSLSHLCPFEGVNVSLLTEDFDCLPLHMPVSLLIIWLAGWSHGTYPFPATCSVVNPLGSTLQVALLTRILVSTLTVLNEVKCDEYREEIKRSNFQIMMNQHKLVWHTYSCPVARRIARWQLCCSI